MNISNTEEVEEEVAANTFGTIIHGVMEKLYLPYINKELKVGDIDLMLQQYEELTKIVFEENYKKGNFEKGKNLILFEIAKRNIFNFLIQERELVSQNTIKILGLEQKLNSILIKEAHPELPFDIKLKGTIDRIDLFNHTLRVIDYKTGKVEEKNLKVDTVYGLTSTIESEKKIQLLLYAILILESNELSNYPMELGIISFRNLNSGFQRLHNNKQPLSINNELINEFKSELIQLILEILNKEKSFIETL